MFDLPDAKRVRREDLDHDADASISSSPSRARRSPMKSYKDGERRDELLEHHDKDDSGIKGEVEEPSIDATEWLRQRLDRDVPYTIVEAPSIGATKDSAQDPTSSTSIASRLGNTARVRDESPSKEEESSNTEDDLEGEDIAKGNSVNPSNQSPPEEDQAHDFHLFAPRHPLPSTQPPTSTSSFPPRPEPLQPHHSPTSPAAPPAPPWPLPSPQRILLRSPTPLANRAAGFVVPHRPASHYFADADAAAWAARVAELASVTVSGETVRRWASGGMAWPGMRYPWRVLRIPGSHVRVRGVEGCGIDKDGGKGKGEGGFEEGGKRKRAGKKKRIRIRVRAARAREAEEKARVEREGRELEEKVKRARRNREKKLKKRERDKVKKARARAEVGLGKKGEEVEVESDTSK